MARTSSASKPEDGDYLLGDPVYLALRSSSWVVIPTGQVFRWHGADHLAAQRQQRDGAKTVPVGAKQGGDEDVPTGPQPAVGLHGNPGAEPVGDQLLVGLGQPELPRGAGVLDRDQRRCPRPPAVARDGHHVRQRLGHPDGDGPHPGPDTSLTDTRASGWNTLRSWISSARSSIE